MAKKTALSIPSLREKMIKKLKESGLNKPSDITKLGFKAITREQVAKIGIKPALAGIKIPYFNLSGKQTSFYRIRYLDDGRDKGLAKIATVEKPQKYSQLAGTENHFYLPPIGGVDWKKVAADPTIPILITEGEFKAACATKAGFPTIGLAGVWNWQKQKTLISDFDAFKMSGREITIIYDSDAAGNYQVAQAENALAHSLTSEKGARPCVAHIPVPPGGGKEGLDDFIVKHGIPALKRLIEKTSVYDEAEELHELNEEVVYVRDPGLILRLDTMQRISPHDFTSHAYANRIYKEKIETAKTTRIVEKSAAKEWLKWPTRSEVAKLTYSPGEERIKDGQFNVWSGWGSVPKKGDVTPWKNLLDHLFQDAPPADRKWFEQWLAYPLQHPGTKLLTGVVIFGIEQGTGKTLIGHTMKQIYGKDNFVEIGQRHLTASFNGVVANKQFVLAEEIVSGDKEIAEMLKTTITRPDIIVNQKYIPEYVLPDHANYFFTSNNPGAVSLEDTDRRFFIHEVTVQPKPREFYKEYDDWYKSAEGAGALFHYFLTLDLTGFDPNAKAPMTAAKRNMAEESATVALAWARKLLDQAEGTKQYGDRPIPLKLFRLKEELLEMFKEVNPEARLNLGGLARALRGAGFRRFHDKESGFSKTQVPVNKYGWGVLKLWMIMPKEEAIKVDRLTQTQLAKMFLKERDEWRDTPALFRSPLTDKD